MISIYIVQRVIKDKYKDFPGKYRLTGNFTKITEQPPTISVFLLGTNLLAPFPLASIIFRVTFDK